MAVTEKVGKTLFATPTDTALVAVRTVDAPRELVWEIHTDPKHMPHWMIGGPPGMKMVVCEIDLRVRGKWRYGWSMANDEQMEMGGEIREIIAPERLVNTERWGGDWPETINTLTLTEENGKTTITTEVLYPSKEALDAALGCGMKEGWSASYDILDEYLRTLVS